MIFVQDGSGFVAPPPPPQLAAPEAPHNLVSTLQAQSAQYQFNSETATLNVLRSALSAPQPTQPVRFSGIPARQQPGARRLQLLVAQSKVGAAKLTLDTDDNGRGQSLNSFPTPDYPFLPSGCPFVTHKPSCTC